MKFSNKYSLNIIIFALVFGCINIYSNDDLKDQIDKINQVIKAASGSHVDNVEASKLVDAAIRGLLKELDPYSYYFTADELEDIANRRSGSYYGVGFNSLWMDDTLQIISIAPNSPAEISGIKIGDQILKISNTSVVGVDKKIAEKLFKGNKNLPLDIEVLNPISRKISKVKLRKIKLPLNSVDASYMIENSKVGYIAVNRFMNSTYYEIIDSLSMLTEKGMESLIIDLRGNPGGLIDQTYMVADEFIPDGDDIIITKGKDPQFNIRYKSSPSGKFEKLPIVLLIDSSTISAPEIFAGAVQDLDRGIIVGKTSYGKGVVQNPIQLSDGSELWLTVAKYFTPSGRSIHKDTVIYKKPKSRVEDRFVIKDGMIFSQSTEVMPQYGYNDSVPIYSSKNGRPIYGGGGITPDFVTEEIGFSDFTGKLVDKNLLVKIALDYFIANKDLLSNKYLNDYSKFYSDFEVDKKITDNLRPLAERNKIEWNETSFDKDLSLIKTSIKSLIAGMIWTNNEKYQIVNAKSNQYRKAIEVIPAAEKILVQRPD